jgi:hypothetical protein
MLASFSLRLLFLFAPLREINLATVEFAQRRKGKIRSRKEGVFN